MAEPLRLPLPPRRISAWKNPAFIPATMLVLSLPVSAFILFTALWDALLEHAGTTTIGHAVSYRPRNLNKSGRRYQVHYVYFVNTRRYRAETTVDEADHIALRSGSTLWVRVLPNYPHLWPFASTSKNDVRRHAQGMLFVLAFWGCLQTPFLFFLSSVRRSRWLVQHGIEASGRVLDKYVPDKVLWGETKGADWCLVYGFTDENGQAQRRTCYIGDPMARNFSVGDELTVLYDRFDSRRNAAYELSDWRVAFPRKPRAKSANHDV